MDFREQVIGIINNFPKQILEGQLMLIQIFWEAIKGLLIEYWIIIIITFFILLALSIFNIYTEGRWGMLAAILYRCSYLGILLIVVLIFGLEIFVSNWIKILSLIIGIVSFELVSYFLRKFRFK
jgi:hypothetical protein